MASKDLVKAKLATLVTILVGLNTVLLERVNIDKNKTNQMMVNVVDVIDGDTFVTDKNYRVRLYRVDAPEQGRCMADEAKKELKKMVKNK